MGASLKRLGPVLSAGLCLAFGLVLKGPPLDPDVLIEPSHIGGAFLIFLGWAVCTASWGRYLARRTGLDSLGLGWLAPTVVLGPVFLSLLIYALGVLGLIGYALFPLHLLLLFSGPVLLAYSNSKGNVLSYDAGEPWTWIEAFLGAGLLYTLLVQVLKASLANGTTDPAIYHLLAPRFWSDQGAIQLWRPWPALTYATYWEHLFVWGNSMLGGPGGKGLIEGQFFGQWVHVFFGVGGTIAVVFALQRLLGVSRAWALAGCLSIPVAKLQATYGSLAKNDFGIVCWTFFAIALLLAPGARKPRVQWGAGCLLGMAVTGKLVYCFSYLPWAALGACALWREPGSRKRMAVLALGVFCGALPVLARNAWFTGNPIFPFLHSWFPDSDWINDVGRSTIDAFSGFRLQSFEGFISPVIRVLRDSPFTPLALLLIPFAALGWAGWSQALITIGAALGILFLCSLDIPNSFIRWVGPSLVAMQLGGAAALEAVLKRWVRSARFVSGLALLPAAYLVSTAANPIPLWNSIIRDSPTMIWRMPAITNGGDSKAWLRMNAKPGETIVSDGDTGFYYMSHLRPFAYFQHPLLGQRISGCVSIRCVIHELRSHNAKYMYDVAHFNQRYYSVVAEALDRAATMVPESVVYAGRDSFVVDLIALEQGLSSACVLDHAAQDDFLVP